MSKLISMYWVNDRPELTYPGGYETALSCDIIAVEVEAVRRRLCGLGERRRLYR
jgi:hypothetical protein